MKEGEPALPPRNASVSTDDIPPEKLRSAHDRFFRRVFSNPAHARGVLRRMLPAALAASLDWRSLRLVPGTYVDEALGPSASDLLFEVHSRTLGPLLVYLLWEHQSTQDPYMPLRLLGYAARCLADHVRGRSGPPGPIPRLVPLVLYQGDQPWTAARRLSELSVPSPGTKELVELELLVHELHAEDAEVLAATRRLTALARAALVAMKLVAAQADLAAHAALLGRLLGEVRRRSGAAGLRPLLTYLLRTRGSERELRAIMEATDSRTGEIVLTAYEKLIKRGKADMLVQLVETKFGSVSAQLSARIQDASPNELDRWAQRLLSASSIDELFDA